MSVALRRALDGDAFPNRARVRLGLHMLDRVAANGDTVRYPDAAVIRTRSDQAGRLVRAPLIVFAAAGPSSPLENQTPKAVGYAFIPSVRRHVSVERPIVELQDSTGS